MIPKSRVQVALILRGNIFCHFPPGWCVLERELGPFLLVILFMMLVPGMHVGQMGQVFYASM
jgi:hypothetical protein